MSKKSARPDVRPRLRVHECTCGYRTRNEALLDDHITYMVMTRDQEQHRPVR